MLIQQQFDRFQAHCCGLVMAFWHWSAEINGTISLHPNLTVTSPETLRTARLMSWRIRWPVCRIFPRREISSSFDVRENGFAGQQVLAVWSGTGMWVSAIC